MHDFQPSGLIYSSVFSDIMEWVEALVNLVKTRVVHEDLSELSRLCFKVQKLVQHHPLAKGHRH